MRAISTLSFEEGTSTLGWRARIALRTRVSMSAMGSLSIVFLPSSRQLPTGFGHPGDFAVQRQAAETEAAHPVLAQECARTPATPTTVAVPAAELRFFRLLGLGQLDIFGDFGGGCH